MTDRRTFLCEDFEISYEDTKKGWSMPYSHHHTNYEIYILLSGERLVTIGDITYRVKAGMASLFESNISHRSVGDTDYTGICTFSRVPDAVAERSTLLSGSMVPVASMVRAILSLPTVPRV